MISMHIFCTIHILKFGDITNLKVQELYNTQNMNDFISA
jgi:hypothetical protein